jgi:hypothetical protein
MTDHKATPEQWHELERHSHSSQPWAPCILELRARVEALEANSKPTPNFSQIGSSLVERVRGIIGLDPAGDGKARAAIREVAAWLREHYGGPTASSTALEQEASDD